MKTTTKTYDPWAHAQQLGIRIVYRNDLPTDWVGCCLPSRNAIFIRHGLTPIVERCALAHEIVHWEKNDRGHDSHREARANRIAAARLINHSQLESLLASTFDVHAIAAELEVTPRILTAHIAAQCGHQLDLTA